MKFIKIEKGNMPEKDEQVLLFNGVRNDTYGLGTIEFDEDGKLHCCSKQNLFNQCEEYAPTHYCKLESPNIDNENIDNKEFNNAVEPAIRYLFRHHNPHTSIYIHYDTAELLTGERCHNISSEIPD